MSDNDGTPGSNDFIVDKDNLYREESVTDLKIATIRQLIPVTLDGSDDTSRTTIFLGSTQLGTPQGPIPMQAELEATTLEEAMEQFPKAMEVETLKVVENLKRMQQMQEQQKSASDSRIIMPGMN
ncbi:MAG: cytoplasmic protein [Desulfobacterium sp.]|nr:cytoplasmic protein [Desulfobacterium sp.]